MSRATDGRTVTYGRAATSGIAVALLLATAACSGTSGDDSSTTNEATTTVAATTDSPMQTTITMTEASDITEASAVLMSASDSTVAGELTITPSNDGIQLTGTVVGLPADAQVGFHIHEVGDCSAPDASSAGGHFNPTDSEHGRQGEDPHHGGDSDNIVADDQGVATVNADYPDLVLGGGGANDAIGRAVIVHADPDDYVSQPAGNAGARVACGVIEAD